MGHIALVILTRTIIFVISKHREDMVNITTMNHAFKLTCGSMSRTTLRAFAASWEIRLAYMTVVDWSRVDLIAMPGS